MTTSDMDMVMAPMKSESMTSDAISTNETQYLSGTRQPARHPTSSHASVRREKPIDRPSSSRVVARQGKPTSSKPRRGAEAQTLRGAEAQRNDLPYGIADGETSEPPTASARG